MGMSDQFGLIKNASTEEVKEWLKEDDKNLLLLELYIAEVQARKGGKRKTHDTHRLEVNLFENLSNLCDDLWERSYKPSRGAAHIIHDPVQREIFAAPYRDRIVHHYIVNSIIDWWEPRLNYDSYSCRVGRGTSFGIKRLDHHIRSVSKMYTKPCYVIKMDISGYFMHINRQILYERVIWGLDRQFEGGRSDERYKILKYAIHEVIFDDPVKGCRIQGSYEDWRGLPKDKSLFYQPPGWGLVIGNLTSQFFSNILLDMLDRYVTIELGYKHYGRYVDDFYIVVTEDELAQAKRDVRGIGAFLEGIGLNLNPKKTRVIPSWQGVPFLGMVVKNGYIVPNKRVYRNFSRAARELVAGEGSVDSIASYLGLIKNYNGKKMAEKVFEKVGWEYSY